MKIMVTGARGNFALDLDQRLSADQELVLYDVEPMGEPGRSVSVQGDIRDAAGLTHAMSGCDAVIHTAGYRQTATYTRNDEDFYSVNVTGTHNVLRAMLLNKIKYLVFSSTEEVHGDGLRGRHLLDESVPCVPTTTYAMTKLLCEEMCRFFARHYGFHIAILRYGHFEPADWRTAGISLLNNGVDRSDVAQANELALGAVLAESFTCESFLVHSQKPFSDSDWPMLVEEPEKVIERYYPGSLELLAKHGLSVPLVHHRYSIEKAVTWLGYDPQYNFEQFLSRLRHQ